MSTTTETTTQETRTVRKPSGLLEKRALAACQEIEREGTGSFAVVWKKSRDYGQCPSISNWHGEKVAHASGCGYDKQSAVLVDLLCWLAPRRVLKSHGAGLRSLQAELRELGWELACDYDGKTEEGYTISRIVES